jgi:hypothetical protein
VNGRRSQDGPDMADHRKTTPTSCVISVGYRARDPTGRIIMTKPTYEELLEALFGVTQALRNTLLLAGNMTGVEKDQRWTITHNAEFMCDAGGHAHYRQAASH